MMVMTADSRRPYFSIFMAVRNAEAFIGPSIRSVLGQDFRDYELVVVNDASTDSTLAQATAASWNESRVRIKTNSEHLGGAWNYKEALGDFRGRVVVELDGDDWFLHDQVLSMLKEHYDDGADATFGGYVTTRGRRSPRKPIVPPLSERLNGTYYCAPRTAKMELARFLGDGWIDPKTGCAWEYMRDIMMYAPIASNAQDLRAISEPLVMVNEIHNQHDHEKAAPHQMADISRRILNLWKTRLPCGEMSAQ